jgi:hypothetical protein
MAAKIQKSHIPLGKIGAKFRKSVLSEFEFKSTHDFRRLDLAAHCLDRIEACRLVIEAEGDFIKDRFDQKREHPALKSERDQKTIFCRIIRELGLDLQDPEESRIPRGR